MRRITDAQETWLPPFGEAVDLRREKLDLVPARNRVGPPRIKKDRPQRLAKGIETRRADLLVPALQYHEGALPVVAAIEHDENAPRVEARLRLVGIARLTRQAEPQNIHRRAEVLDLEAGGLSQRGGVAIGSDRQRGADFDLTPAISHSRTDSHHAIGIGEEAGCLRAHEQAERREGLRVRGEKIEEIPLRHHRNEWRSHGEV